MQTQPAPIFAHLSTRKALVKQEIFPAEMILLWACAAESQNVAAKSNSLSLAIQYTNFYLRRISIHT